MDWTQLLIQAAGTSATMLIIALLAQVANRNVEVKSDGSRQLWLPNGIAAVGWVSVIIGLAPLLALVFVEEEGLWMIALPLGTVSLGLGTWTLFTFYNHTVWFDGRRARVTDEWRREEALYFSEVHRARIVKLSGNLRLFLRDGRKIDVSPYLKGYAIFKARLDAFLATDEA